MLSGDSTTNRLTEEIIGIAINIHKQLGPGLAEKIYQRIMYLELKKTNLRTEREYKITVKWNKCIVGYHIVDFMINDELILELKATGETQDLHKYQLLSYLKAANKKLGLVLNFGSPILGIKRVVNN
jgi:GxxExxY protein